MSRKRRVPFSQVTTAPTANLSFLRKWIVNYFRASFLATEISMIYFFRAQDWGITLKLSVQISLGLHLRGGPICFHWLNMVIDSRKCRNLGSPGMIICVSF